MSGEGGTTATFGSRVLDSDRSRVVVCAGHAALMSFDKKLGAIFEDYSVS